MERERANDGNRAGNTANRSCKGHEYGNDFDGPKGALDDAD